jgi:hypothetical protein
MCGTPAFGLMALDIGLADGLALRRKSMLTRFT